MKVLLAFALLLAVAAATKKSYDGHKVRKIVVAVVHHLTICSRLTWVVEENCTSRNTLCSTHCREFYLKLC